MTEQPRNPAEKTNQKTQNYNLDLSIQRGQAKSTTENQPENKSNLAVWLTFAGVIVTGCVSIAVAIINTINKKSAEATKELLVQLATPAPTSTPAPTPTVTPTPSPTPTPSQSATLTPNPTPNRALTFAEKQRLLEWCDIQRAK